MDNKLKIGFDGKKAAQNKVGLGTYARNTILNLLEYYPNNEYFVYSSQPFLESYSGLFNDKKNLSNRCPDHKLLKPRQWLWQFFKQPAQIKKDQLHVFHGLSHTLPRNVNCAKVLTMHDLIYLRHPEWFKWHDRISYDVRFRKSAKQADLILTISDTSKKDLVDFYELPSSKVKVTYQPCNSIYKKLELSSDEINELRKKFDIRGRPIVCVGTIEPRKNGLNIAKSFYNLGPANKDFDLLFIGKQTPFASEIQNFVSKNNISNIKFLSYVDMEDLVRLYNIAHLSIYAPYFEGFGLPVLESMQCGTPVLTSNISSLPEVGGTDSSYLCDPSSVESMTEALKVALSDESHYQEIISNIDKHIEKFSPKSTAQKTMDAYLSLL